MHNKGLFTVVKTAGKNASVVSEIKAAYLTPKFPYEECRAKIAKRFGEDAIALSGPNKGTNLADCVCNQLKNASVYSDGLAVRVADSWAEKDGCIQCIEDYVRVGFDMEKAATVCQYMKLKYAGSFELFAEDLSDLSPVDDSEGGFPHHGHGHKEEVDDIGNDFDDPFADDSSPEGDVPPETPGGDLDTAPEGNPMEVELGPVDDSPVGGDLGLELPDVGPEVGGSEDEHGTVTIKLPLSALDAIEEAIDLAHGETPGEEAHHDIPPGDMDKEVEVELPGGAADELEEVIEPALNDEVGESSDDEENFDGGSDDEEEDEGGMGFGGDSEGPSEEPDAPSSESPIKEGDEMKESDHLASFMRRGKVSAHGEINLDVDAIAKAIGMKTAGESEPKLERAQDAVDGIQANDGSVIGNENKFTADKPKVPRGDATMGPDEHNPKDKPLPKVPTGDAEMGSEKELGYTSDGASLTGGDKGQGKTETAKNKNQMSVNSGKQVTVPTKQADKLEHAKPVADTDGLNVPRSHKDLESTPPSMKREPFTEKENFKKVEKGEGARIKGEVDMGSVPKADKAEYIPDIPVGGPPLRGEEKSNKENAPEKELARKGTIIAKGDEKSQKLNVAVEAEAVRLAGRMVEEKIIGPSQLLEKIAELKMYQMNTLKQIEKTLFATKTQKGLDVGPDGVEQPVIINESSNERPQTREGELTESLQSLFTLHKRNVLASQNEDAAMRRAHNRA